LQPWWALHLKHGASLQLNAESLTAAHATWHCDLYKLRHWRLGWWLRQWLHPLLLSGNVKHDHLAC